MRHVARKTKVLYRCCFRHHAHHPTLNRLVQTLDRIEQLFEYCFRKCTEGQQSAWNDLARHPADTHLPGEVISKLKQKTQTQASYSLVRRSQTRGVPASIMVSRMLMFMWSFGTRISQETSSGSFLCRSLEKRVCVGMQRQETAGGLPGSFWSAPNLLSFPMSSPAFVVLQRSA